MRTVFEEAQEKYGIEKFYAGLSGGKDSISATDVADKLGFLEGCFFIDTTIGLPETKVFVEDYCQERGWKLIILKPQHTYEDFIMKFGFPTFRFHNVVMGKLKYQPMRKFILSRPERSAIISGVRKFESKRRGRTMQPIIKDGKMVFVAPIFDWTTEKVWKYVDDNNLPRSPAYKTLHISGDCLCGAFADATEANLIRMFYPDIANKISELEKICPKKQNKWGNSGMCGTANQKKLENFVCADCQIGGRNGLTTTKKMKINLDLA